MGKVLVSNYFLLILFFYNILLIVEFEFFFYRWVFDLGIVFFVWGVNMRSFYIYLLIFYSDG